MSASKFLSALPQNRLKIEIQVGDKLLVASGFATSVSEVRQTMDMMEYNEGGSLTPFKAPIGAPQLTLELSVALNEFWMDDEALLKDEAAAVPQAKATKPKKPRAPQPADVARFLAMAQELEDKD